MKDSELVIGGAPLLAPPPPLPPEPENPDQSGLRNMVEETVDEKQKTQPKGAGGAGLPTVPSGKAAVLVCDSFGVVSWVSIPDSNPGMLISNVSGTVHWLEATGVGMPVLQLNGNSMIWLSTSVAGVAVVRTDGGNVEWYGNPGYNAILEFVDDPSHEIVWQGGGA